MHTVQTLTVLDKFAPDEKRSSAAFLDTGGATLPDDLREWMEEQSLARLVVAAGQAARISNKTGTGRDLPGCNGESSILSLITYYYALGIYSSQDIEGRATQDEMVRQFAAEFYPEAGILRSFRRHNRGELQRSLQYVLEQAWLLHCDANLSLWARGDAGWTAASFAVKAQDRINRAVEIDSVERDE